MPNTYAEYIQSVDKRNNHKKAWKYAFDGAARNFIQTWL